PALPTARLALSPDSRARTRGGMPEAVADALREGILDGVLGPGAWLREVEIARELNVSRTPVRDALRILAMEGLVDINTNHGAMVSPMTSDDVLELYEVRETLEAAATRLVTRRARRRCLDEFARLIPEMTRAAVDNDIRELSRLNFRFHVVIRDAAD